MVTKTVVSVALVPGASIGDSAICPAPKKVLGGGASVGSSVPGDNVTIWASEPNATATGWSAKAQRDPFVPPGGTAFLTLNIHAICANVSP